MYVYMCVCIWYMCIHYTLMCICTYICIMYVCLCVYVILSAGLTWVYNISGLLYASTMYILYHTATGKLELAQRGYSSGRMAYIIADLRYVLRNRPTAWTPGLRSSFIDSYQVFLTLLDLIQVKPLNS